MAMTRVGLNRLAKAAGWVLLGWNLLCGPISADAKTFRIAAGGDMLGLDPHLNNEALTNGMKVQIFEALITRAPDLTLEPGLATQWTLQNPTTYRFTLRPAVNFHDGSAFSADDVVFSVQRMMHPNSTMVAAVPGLLEARKIDDLTVDIMMKEPDPVFLQGIPFLFIVSKTWSEKNNQVVPGTGASPTTLANLSANGTGPFKVIERVADTLTVLVPHEGWWGTAKHNLTRVEFRPISNSATRLAALASGEVDMAFPVAPNDVQRLSTLPGVRVIQGPGLMTVFFGLDQRRAELLDMPGSGKNPLKDLRVRKAMYQAIDINAISRVIMRGASVPSGLLFAPGINGFSDDLNTRLPYDPAGVKALLAEAGYAAGFPITLDCPNDRYLNDEAICIAVVAMLNKVGIRASLAARTKALHFAKAGKPQNFNTSFYMLGWIPGTFDAHHVLVNLATENGVWNAGGYRNERVEELTTAIGKEFDPAKRNAMLAEAWRLHNADVGHLPLHQQANIWGVRDSVASIVQSPLDWVYFTQVTMK